MKLLILAAVLAVLVGIPVAALLWMTSVPGRPHSGGLPPLSAEQAALARRLDAHVRAIASVPHNVAYPAELERAARYIETELGGLGYEVRPQRFQAAGVEVRNIEAVIEPAAEGAETLVVGAHYDSAFEAPGANDNGTGTAAVLELARTARRSATPITTPGRTRPTRSITNASPASSRGSKR